MIISTIENSLRFYRTEEQKTGPLLEGNVGSSQASRFFPWLGEVGVLMGMILGGRENAVIPEIQ